MKFCNEIGREPWPAREETIMRFLIWLELQGRGRAAPGVMSAVRWWHKSYGDLGDTGSVRVKLVEKGLRRESVTEGRKEVREPFPLEALKWWVEKGKVKGLRKWRDPALVALGIRCMRRPGELTELKRRHVTVTKGGLELFLPRSKTDQFMKGRTLHVKRT